MDEERPNVPVVEYRPVTTTRNRLEEGAKRIVGTLSSLAFVAVAGWCFAYIGSGRDYLTGMVVSIGVTIFSALVAFGVIH
jgi:hypothetical protein